MALEARGSFGPPRIRIGISGWSYPPWRGYFYPKGLRQADELAYASRAFSTIELNGSFYSLQSPRSYAAWYRVTPPDFVFAVKGSRFITHMKHLQNVEGALANFFASGLLCLGEKLGPILWQLPPRFRFDAPRLRAFFELLPQDLRGLERLARRHDARLEGRAALDALVDNRPVRHALEVRHASFADPKYIDLLREYGVASCVADSAGLYPIIDEVTADFSYFRLHGAERLYVSGYERKALQSWAERIQRLSPAQQVYVYFDNDVKVRAPFDARNLALLLQGRRRLTVPRELAAVSERPRESWPAWQGMHVAKRGAMATRKSSRKGSKKAGARKTARKVGSRGYGKKAQSKVGRSMREMKSGELRSGSSGKKVRSRKQAIAIGLSEARRAGGKAPPPRKSSAKRGTRAATRKRSTRRAT